MLKLNRASFLNYSSPKLWFLWLPRRCFSTRFTCIIATSDSQGIRPLYFRANHSSLVLTKCVRTSSKGYGALNKKHIGCYDVLNTLNNFTTYDIPPQHAINMKSRRFSTSKDLLTEESYKEQDDSCVEKDISLSSKRIFGGNEYEFDIDGYLSVDDVVKFLQHEAAYDICVIKTSGAKRAYVDYFIVVSGVSNRHLRAMSKNLEQLFKGHSVRGVSKHGHVTVEGLESDSNWMAVDIGNMVVHFFLPEVREMYELEKLWALGPKYDDQYKALLEEEEFLQAVFLGEQKKSPNVED